MALSFDLVLYDLFYATDNTLGWLDGLTLHLMSLLHTEASRELYTLPVPKTRLGWTALLLFVGHVEAITWPGRDANHLLSQATL